MGYPERFQFQFILAFVFLLFFSSCTDGPSEEKETVVTGRAVILVDETFEPIIEDQMLVFESAYKHAQLSLINAPENRVIHMLLKDSAKVAILARKLSENETATFTAKNIIPKTTKFATDAIAIIAHESNPDSVMSVEEIIQILKGTSPGKKSLVFDNPNSSTVRYLKELADIDTLSSSGAYALQSNAAVIQYVHENPTALGIVGLNWLAQPGPQLESMVQELKALQLKAKESDQLAYSPNQSNLALGLYPLARDLYLINCQGTYGLGLGFSAFLAGERGQRIILKSGLLPDSIPSRELIIRN